MAAFALAMLFGAAPAIEVGLVILAAYPSGVTSNAYTIAARADVPLCVTLSAVTSVITVLTIPCLIYLAFQVFFEQGEMRSLPIVNMLRELMLLTLIPVALGMFIRAGFLQLAKRTIEPIRKVVLILLIIVLLLAAVSSYEVIVANFPNAGALMVTMNLATMGLGFFVAHLFKLRFAQVITIAPESGSRIWL